MQPLWGKYRGKVIENEDPLFLGRILVELAALPGVVMNWCMPCTPYGGMGVGFYAIPPLGANVWVEFEGGDVGFPIWVGCFWGEGETPIAGEPPNPFVKTLKTEFITLALNDTPELGGITLTCLPPAVPVPLTMTFNAAGVSIYAPPASFKMMPEGGVTMTFPPGMISMSEAGVTIATPPTTVSVTPEGVVTNAPTVETTSMGTIVMNAGAEISVTTEGALTLQAGLAANVTAAGAATVTAAEVLSLSGSLVLLN